MKITLTNGEMYASLVALIEASETGKLGYAIAKNRRKIQAELTEYIGIREELLRKHGTDNGTGIFTFADMEAAEKFNAELEEYAKINSELDLMVVPQDVFVSGGLTSDQMYTLDWMEEEEVE